MSFLRYSEARARHREFVNCSFRRRFRRRCHTTYDRSEHTDENMMQTTSREQHQRIQAEMSENGICSGNHHQCHKYRHTERTEKAAVRTKDMWKWMCDGQL